MNYYDEIENHVWIDVRELVLYRENKCLPWRFACHGAFFVCHSSASIAHNIARRINVLMQSGMDSATVANTLQLFVYPKP